MYTIDKNKEFQDGNLYYDKKNIFEIKDFDERRNHLRMNIVNSFGKEAPGTINLEDKKTKYRYIINEIKSQNQIYQIILERPAYNYKGFDFVVKVLKKDNPEDKIFINNNNTTSRPSHNDVKKDLIIKYKYDRKLYFWLIEQIKKIYYIDKSINYEEIREKQKEIDNSKNKNFFGLNIELLLNIIDWLFIEQDIRYWNGLGRKYIYNLFIAPIFELKRQNQNIRIVHYEADEKIDLDIEGKCNANFYFNELYLYSNENQFIKYNKNNCVENQLDTYYYHKMSNNTYLIKEKSFSYLKRLDKATKKYNELNVLEKNIKYLLGFDNRIWLYSSSSENIIEEINGISLNTKNFLISAKYIEKTDWIIILNENWKGSLNDI